MVFDPATEIQNLLVFGEFGDVNPSIGDASTYTFLNPEEMEEAFKKETPDRYLYSRHWNPTNKYLSMALAKMEAAEKAQVFSSGMAAISCSILALCQSNDEIITHQDLYGGTYALLNNFLPKFNIKTHFIDLENIQEIKAHVNDKTKIIYCETLSNPLLKVNDIKKLALLAKDLNLKLVVDNTFAPMLISPLQLGADVTVYSLTKFINGTSDCIAGAVISSTDFIDQLNNCDYGPSMLIGASLDSARAASILKNLHSLHIRMRKHGDNAQYIAQKFTELGFTTHYPGLASNSYHKLFNLMANPGYGYGGIVTVDLGNKNLANKFMLAMQEASVGYIAVSLGYFKTLFTAPSHSTSSEILDSDKKKAGISDGLIRFSIGLDNDIHKTWDIINSIIKDMNLQDKIRIDH